MRSLHRSSSRTNQSEYQHSCQHPMRSGFKAISQSKIQSKEAKTGSYMSTRPTVALSTNNRPVRIRDGSCAVEFHYIPRTTHPRCFFEPPTQDNAHEHSEKDIAIANEFLLPIVFRLLHPQTDHAIDDVKRNRNGNGLGSFVQHLGKKSVTVPRPIPVNP